MKLDLDALGVNSETVKVPRHIAVEGSIGVGKTTLARNLAETFGYETLLELPEENPFLDRFYADPVPNALPTQLFFLFQRTRQLQEASQVDLFNGGRVSDFLIDKDPIFAEVTLDEDELRLYRMVYDKLTIDVPQPDLVIYLQAPTEVLQKRIRGRGLASEQRIAPEYLAKLNDAYASYFHYYRESPLLIVNATEVNLAENQNDYADLVEYLLKIKSGTHYYNPISQKQVSK